jgi:hypothetical protein
MYLFIHHFTNIGRRMIEHWPTSEEVTLEWKLRGGVSRQENVLRQTP